MVDVQERQMAKEARRGLQEVFRGYDADEEMPFAGYATLLALYGAAFGGLLLTARALGRPLPRRVRPSDVLLLGVATHKLSRLVTKAWVTSPLRAPFTEYRGEAGPGEVDEAARGTSLRKAIGELLTCPWCMGAWISSLFASGLLLAPRLTRLAGMVFCMEAVSDFLNLGYAAAKKAVD